MYKINFYILIIFVMKRIFALLGMFSYMAKKNPCSCVLLFVIIKNDRVHFIILRTAYCGYGSDATTGKRPGEHAFTSHPGTVESFSKSNRRFRFQMRLCARRGRKLPVAIQEEIIKTIAMRGADVHDERNIVERVFRRIAN